MPQLRKTTSPKLSCSATEHIAKGVAVHPIQFRPTPGAPPFATTYFEVLPGCQTPEDVHQEQEIWIVLQGKGILNCEGSFSSVAEHDMYYFASFQKHQVINHFDETLLICSLYW